jgi:hypothetical protein
MNRCSEEALMLLTRLIGTLLVAMACMSCAHSTARGGDPVTWSAAVSGCVANATGLAVYGSNVYNHGGGTVFLFCAISPAELRGGFDTIEVSYNAGNWPTTGEGGDMVRAELREVSRSTEQVTVKCAVQPQLVGGGPRTARNLCNNSEVNFNRNYYYVQVEIRDSPTTTGDGVFVGSVLLISTR